MINTVGGIAGSEVRRELLLTYVDANSLEPSGTPDWEVIGWKIQDSSIELNVDEETITDILAITHTTVNDMQPSQTLEPNVMRSGPRLSPKLLEIYRKNEFEKYAMFNVLVVFAFLGAPGTPVVAPFEADMQTGCTVRPTSIGGDRRVNFPLQINYSKNTTHGTVDKIFPDTDITFTPAP